MVRLCCNLTLITGLVVKSGGGSRSWKAERLCFARQDFASSLLRQELEFLTLNRGNWGTYVDSEGSGESEYSRFSGATETLCVRVSFFPNQDSDFGTKDLSRLGA